MTTSTPTPSGSGRTGTADACGSAALLFDSTLVMSLSGPSLARHSIILPCMRFRRRAHARDETET
ncbi:hypothetical protein [Nocardia pseudobrasiliensis]|uniref:hypothetical protein n=1 Tax=Nocardia pseudobrasiliensis TaxID=45979 RepID=UPI001FE45F21|nr:hypothetical protein [Nocardia pseudobrasiliensis]